MLGDELFKVVLSTSDSCSRFNLQPSFVRFGDRYGCATTSQISEKKQKGTPLAP